MTNKLAHIPERPDTDVVSDEAVARISGAGPDLEVTIAVEESGPAGIYRVQCIGANIIGRFKLKDLF